MKKTLIVLFLTLGFVLISGCSLSEKKPVDNSGIEKSSEKFADIIKIFEKDGLTPLMVANKLKNLDAVKSLVSKGADLEAKGGEFKSSVLIQASEQGNIEIMKYLVENKANIEAIDVDGGTPLDCAAFEGQTEAIKYLVSVGANINHQGPVWANTALILASMNGHFDTVKYLLSIGASKALKNKKDKTAYDVAKTAEIKKLLE